jgi:hypothetical protein
VLDFPYESACSGLVITSVGRDIPRAVRLTDKAVKHGLLGLADCHARYPDTLADLSRWERPTSEGRIRSSVDRETCSEEPCQVDPPRDFPLKGPLDYDELGTMKEQVAPQISKGSTYGRN